MKKLLLALCLLMPVALGSCKKDKGGGGGGEGEEPGRMVIPERTLPVIFHILYENERDIRQNPSGNLIRLRLDQMNKFYAGTLYPDAGSPNTGIKFMLATHDPQGRKLKEPGINRVYRAGSDNITTSWFMGNRTLSAQDKVVNWDQNQYVNIWVFGFNDDETGWAYYPYALDQSLPGLNFDSQGYFLTRLPPYMHGISLNNRYFSEDYGMSTLCHEMGHYLGLLHPFIETTATNPYCTPSGSDYDDDFCADTPIYSRAEYENSYQTYEYYRMGCGGDYFLSTNIMDYWYGVRDRFTPEQKARIDYVYANCLLIPRPVSKTKALFDSYTGELGDQMPTPILVE